MDLRPVYAERDHDHERYHCDFPLKSLHKPATVHTERGNLGCDSRNVCCHAPSHESGSKSHRHRFWWHFRIFTSSHGGGEGRGDTGVCLYTGFYRRVIRCKVGTEGYRRCNEFPRIFLFFCVFKSTTALVVSKLGVFQLRQFSSSSVLSGMLSTGALRSQVFYVYCVLPGPSYRKTKELIGWQEIVRATIAQKFALEAISGTFRTNQFPAAFVVAFSMNGFIQIA